MSRQTTAPAAAAEEPPGFARGLAFLLRSTQRRPVTVAEARDKLRGRDLDPEAVEAVIARARTLGVLDDRSFARAWVGDRGIGRGYGRARLRRELRRRRVDTDVADEALTLLDDVDEVEQATEIARAKAQGMPATIPPERVAHRLLGILVRRGFDADVAHRVARQVTALDRDWD